MRYWSATVSADRYQVERLYQQDVLEIAGSGEVAGTGEVALGDRVALVAGTTPPVVFAFGEVITIESERGLVIRYTDRFFDDPQPAGDLVTPDGRAHPGIAPVPPATFAALARRAGDQPPVRTWLVSLDLPIEATGPAEAVRQFWTYVHGLGPRELPAFVAPVDDELALQAFVLGEEANQDPEES